MSKEKLVNQHILEYEARLKHIEELFTRAHKATEHLDDDHHIKSELGEISSQKEDLVKEVEEVKTMDVEHWQEEMVSQAGPMAIWDILAQRLELFVEEHEDPINPKLTK